MLQQTCRNIPGTFFSKACAYSLDKPCNDRLYPTTEVTPAFLLLSACLFLTVLFLSPPSKVVSFFSLRYDTAPTWMVLAVLWCSMVQTLLLPSFIWSCERYRADLRTIWEQCVAIMSEEDGDDGKPLTTPQTSFQYPHSQKTIEERVAFPGKRT